MPGAENVAPRLTVGTSAPSFQVVDSTGGPVELSSLWQGRRVLLSFVRHFG